MDACDSKNASQTFSQHHHRVIQEVEMIRKRDWIFTIRALGRLLGPQRANRASICGELYFPKLTFLTRDTDTNTYQDERTMDTHRAFPDVVLSSFDFPAYQIRNCGCINRWFSLFHLFISKCVTLLRRWDLSYGKPLVSFVFMEIYAAGANPLVGKFEPRQLGVTYDRAYRMKAIIKYIE